MKNLTKIDFEMPKASSKLLRPRKKPVQRRAVVTVSSVIEAAAQILETLGLNAVNTNAVAERAGVSVGSLYQYFPGKDALLIALMRREKERFRDDAAAALECPTGLAALRQLIAAAVRHQLYRPELARLLDIEEARPAAQQEVAGVSRLRDVLCNVLLRPDLPPQLHPDVAVQDLLSLVQVLVDSAGARGERDARALEQRVLGAVLGYLHADNRRPFVDPYVSLQTPR